MAWSMTLEKEGEGPEFSGYVGRGYELEDGVLGRILHEPHHRVVALGIEERSSYWHFSDVALKDRACRLQASRRRGPGSSFLATVQYRHRPLCRGD